MTSNQEKIKAVGKMVAGKPGDFDLSSKRPQVRFGRFIDEK